MDTKKSLGDRIRSAINWLLIPILVVVIGLVAYQLVTGNNVVAMIAKVASGQTLVDGKPVVVGSGSNRAVLADPTAEKFCGKGSKTLEVRSTGENQYSLVGPVSDLYPNESGTTYFIKEEIPVGTIGWMFQGKSTTDEYNKILAFDANKASTNHECTDTGCPALFNTSLSLGNGDRNANYWTKDGSNKLYLKNEPLAIYEAFKEWFLKTYEAARAGKPLPRCVSVPAIKDMQDISSSDKAELEGKNGLAKADGGKPLPAIARTEPTKIAANATATPSIEVSSPEAFVAPLPLPTATPYYPVVEDTPVVWPTPYAVIQEGGVSLEKLAEDVNLLGGPAFVRADSCTNNQPNDWANVYFVIPSRPDLALYADLSGIYANYLGGGCTSISLVNESGAGYPVADTAGNTHFSLTGFSANAVQQAAAPAAQASNPTPVPPTWKQVGIANLGSESWTSDLRISQGGDNACRADGSFSNEAGVYASNGMESFVINMAGYGGYLILPHCQDVVFSRSVPSVPHMQFGSIYVAWLSQTPPAPAPTPTPNLVWNWGKFMSDVIAPFPQDHPVWVQCTALTGNETQLAPQGLCSDWRFTSRVTFTDTDLPKWNRALPLTVKNGRSLTEYFSYAEVPGQSSWFYTPLK